MKTVLHFSLIIMLFASIGCSPSIEDKYFTVTEVSENGEIHFKNGYRVRLIGVRASDELGHYLSKNYQKKKLRIKLESKFLSSRIQKGVAIPAYVVNEAGFCLNSIVLQNRIAEIDKTELRDSMKAFVAYSESAGLSGNKSRMDASDIFAQYKNSTVHIFTNNGTGTGFFVTPSIGITNQHVVENASQILLRIENGTTFNARVLYKNVDIDLAVFELIDDYKFSPIPLTTRSISPGQEIVVIGNPNQLQNTVTKGIISAIREGNNRVLSFDALQFDAAISPGNSGGPILNSYGEVIGVVCSYMKDMQNTNFGVHYKYINQVLQEIGIW